MLQNGAKALVTWALLVRGMGEDQNMGLGLGRWLDMVLELDVGLCFVKPLRWGGFWLILQQNPPYAD